MIVESQVMINLWKRKNQKSLPLPSENETLFNAQISSMVVALLEKDVLTHYIARMV